MRTAPRRSGHRSSCDLIRVLVARVFFSSITPAPGLVPSWGGGIRLLSPSAAQGDRRWFSAAGSRQLVHRRRLVTARQVKTHAALGSSTAAGPYQELGVNSTSAFLAGPGAGNVLNQFAGLDDGGESRRKVFYPDRPGAAPVSKSYSGGRFHQPVQRAGTLTSGCRRPSFALPSPCSG